MAYPANPNIQYVDIFQFEGDVPFSWTTDQKFNANLQSTASVNLDRYKDNHEVLAAEIKFTGPFANPDVINVKFTWTRKSDNKVIHTGTISVPTPKAQGYSYWNWYRLRSWIGKRANEINGPGNYECKVDITSKFGYNLSETLTKTVTGTQQPVYTRFDATFNVQVYARTETGWPGIPYYPRVLFDITPGLHTVEIYATGYKTMTFTHTWLKGEVWPQKSYIMEKLPTKSSVLYTVVTMVNNKQVKLPDALVDVKNVGKFYTNSAGEAKFDVDVGSYTVTVTKSGYKSHTQTIQISKAGTNYNFVANLVKEEAPAPPPPPPPPKTALDEAVAKIFADMLYDLMQGKTPWSNVLQWEQQCEDILTQLINAALKDAGLPTQANLFGIDVPLANLALFAAFMVAPEGQAAKLSSNGAKLLGEAASEKLAGEILEWGVRDLKGLGNWLVKLSDTERKAIFIAAQKVKDPYSVNEVLQKAYLSAKLPTLQEFVSRYGLKIAGTLIGFAAAYSFLGFPFEEADQRALGSLVGLVNDKKWKLASEQLPVVENIMLRAKAATDTLRAVPLLGNLLSFIWGPELDAANASLNSIKKQIEDGLKEEEIPTTISIVTNVDPAWAEIVGVLTTKTPLIRKEIAPASYSVIAQKEGYKTETRTVLVKEKQDNLVSFALEKIEPEIPKDRGKLEVVIYDYKTNSPIAATLIINGSPEPYHLHSYVIELKADTYEITVEESGYKTYHDTVVIDAQKTTKLDVKLVKVEEPVPPPPSITCETFGYWTTPPGPVEKYEQVSVQGLLCWQLKTEKVGKVEVSSSPTASVWLAGTKVVDNTPAVLDLMPGMYMLEFRADGYISKTATVYVKAGERSVISVILEAIAAPPKKRKVYRIDVNSVPTGAKILINYSFTNKYTPDYVLLDPGEYLLQLTKTGYKAWSTPLVLEEL